MNKLKHTKGPWSVSYSKENLEFRITASALCDALVARIDDEPDVGIIEDEILSNEAKANAALITAAPEMYEALEELVKAYRDLKVQQGGFMGDSYREAQNALKKARGES